jgi:hypothetical protein
MEAAIPCRGQTYGKRKLQYLRFRGEDFSVDDPRNGSKTNGEGTHKDHEADERKDADVIHCGLGGENLCTVTVVACFF